MNSVVVSNDEGSISEGRHRDNLTNSTHATTSTSSLESSDAATATSASLVIPNVSLKDDTVCAYQSTYFPPFHSKFVSMEPLSTLPPTMMMHPFYPNKTSEKPTPYNILNLQMPHAVPTLADHTSRNAINDRGGQVSAFHPNTHLASPMKLFYGPNDVVTVPNPLKNLFITEHHTHEASTLNTTVPEFMFQLTKLLSDNNKEFIEWVDGVIKVYDPPKLASDVLHKYFRHSKYSSFQRQLNYFGFRKISGKGKLAPCSYINDHVTSDLLSLLSLKRIQRPSKAETASIGSQDHTIHIHHEMDSSKESTKIEATTHVVGEKLGCTAVVVEQSHDHRQNQQTLLPKSSRKRKSHDSGSAANPDEGNHHDHNIKPTKGLSPSSSKQRKQSSRHSTRPSEVDSLVPSTHPSRGGSIPVFLDPFQLGMDGTMGGFPHDKDDTTSMRRDSSLLHLAMIPQVPSLSDFIANVDDVEVEEEALMGINFMDFY